ncbi:hypothetical protein T484DRAFT_1922236, partial [Baffinella frigidus]
IAASGGAGCHAIAAKLRRRRAQGPPTTQTIVGAGRAAQPTCTPARRTETPRCSAPNLWPRLFSLRAWRGQAVRWSALRLWWWCGCWTRLAPSAAIRSPRATR